MSLFINIGVPIMFTFALIVGLLFWYPLGMYSGMENPLDAMLGTVLVDDVAIIAWTVIVLLFALFLIFKAIQKWRKGNKTPVKLFLHLLIFVIGVFFVAMVGSINFPFVT